MAQRQYRAEKRIAMLADAIEHRIEVTMNVLAPDGKRPLFSQQQTKGDALAFWQRHRYDPLGQSILSHWKPDRVAALDAWLAAEAAKPAPSEAGSLPPPGIVEANAQRQGSLNARGQGMPQEGNLFPL